MTEAKLTSKGRVTIPKAVRERLGLATGDTIAFVDTDRGIVVVPARRGLDASCGMFEGRRAKPATLAGIRGAIAEMGSEAAR